MQSVHRATPLKMSRISHFVCCSTPRVSHCAPSLPRWVLGTSRKIALGVGLVGLCTASLVFSVSALEARKVGEFNASGLVFKDAVEVMAVEDPVVKGVTLYLSDFKRSFADKVASMDFINEPSQSSVTCAATGPITLPEMSVLGGPEGKQVFSETKSRTLLVFGNKTLRIRRIYDRERNTLTYISYSTRIGSAGEEGRTGTSRYRTSICVVPVNQSISEPISAPVTSQ